MLALAPSPHHTAAQPPPDTQIICTLSKEQTDKAIEAFDRLMPVFHHDRCANCHNKIDPFLPSKHVNIRETFEQFRNKDKLAEFLRIKKPVADINKVHAAIMSFLGSGPMSGTDRITMMFATTCLVCHDPPPGTDSWRMPPASDSFHDKDRVQICGRMHTSDLTTPPADFEHHMNFDAFIQVGFAGTRGLNAFGESIYQDTSGSAYAPQPLTSPSFTKMTEAARDWLAAQDYKYRPNPECGCRPFRYALQVDQLWEGSMAGGVTWNSRGQSGTKIPLEFDDRGEFQGEGTLAISMENQGAGPGSTCTWTNTTDITWKVRGTVSDAGLIHIIGVQELAPRALQMTCRTAGGPVSFARPADAPRSEPVSLQMRAEVGSRVEHVRRWDTAMPIKDTAILTLVEESQP
jgi:hypothetical protein